MIGPVKMPEVVKITAITYCDFIRDDLSDWLDELPLSELIKSNLNAQLCYGTCS